MVKKLWQSGIQNMFGGENIAWRIEELHKNEIKVKQKVGE